MCNYLVIVKLTIIFKLFDLYSGLIIYIYNESNNFLKLYSDINFSG